MSLPGLRTRVLIVAAILAVAFGGLVARLVHLQIVRHAGLAALAERQYSRTVALNAPRGPIVDRHGAPLATSSPAESLFAHPKTVGDPVRVAARLAPILQMREAELHAALVSGRSFVWLRRRLPPAVAAQVKALREPGLDFVPEPLRLYPNRELAAHVIGFDGGDGGLEGVESAWEKELSGTTGKAIVGRDGRGREVESQRILKSPVPGHGVMLTLDTNIQYVAEREIDAAFRRTGAKAAMAVVMEPRTGDVLAIAIRPTFNPNTFMDPRVHDNRRNRAITDPFEPGSTFKVILAAAALEEGVVTPDTRFYAENGAITIAHTTIHDWKKYGWLTFSEVLENSSNIGSIKVGLALGADRYYRHMTAFGFGAPTSVGLPGESRGQLREPRRWSALSLPTMSLGQEISVTALQLVAAFGAVANGGTLMQPRLVRAIFDADGREVRRFEPKAVRQVISKETAQTLTRVLVRVVEHGTGHNAAIAGYEVGGKTGTAQKLDRDTGRYSRAPGVLSFVGFAPADAPRFVMLVMLDEPKNEKWGSEAAAPIFATIGHDILRYLEVPSRDVGPVPIVSAPAGEPGAPRDAGLLRLVSVTAPGERPPGREPSGEMSVAVRGERLPSREPSSEMIGIAAATAGRGERMPDVKAKTKRQALALLAPFKVEVEMTGQGLVVNQAPPAGARLETTATVHLTFAPPTVETRGPARPIAPPAEKTAVLRGERLPSGEMARGRGERPPRAEPRAEVSGIETAGDGDR